MPGGGTWKEVARSRTRERHAFKKAGRFSNGGQHPTLQGRQAAAWQTGKGASEEKRKPSVYGKACPSLADSEKRNSGAPLAGKSRVFLQRAHHLHIFPAGLPRFTSTHLLKRLVPVSSSRAKTKTPSYPRPGTWRM